MGQDCDTLKSCSITGPTHGSVFVQSSMQALQNRIWNLGLNSKNPYKGKNQAFEAKLGLIWDHFGTFWDFVVIFMKTEEKTGKKGMVATFPISKFM